MGRGGGCGGREGKGEEAAREERGNGNRKRLRVRRKGREWEEVVGVEEGKGSGKRRRVKKEGMEVGRGGE